MRVALAQINVTVGDLAGNLRKITRWIERARGAGADLVVFPELAVTGYPPEDLLFKASFVRENQEALRRIASLTKGITAVIGFADRDSRGRLYNAAAVASGGRISACYHKMHLPNYGVFDEKRYFFPGEKPLLIREQRAPIGVSICEDIWVKEGPCQAQARAGARILVNLSASPYHAGKRSERERILRATAKGCKAFVLYVNLIGGQDELVFDGGSLLVSPQGKVIFRAPQFEEAMGLVDLRGPAPRGLTPSTGPLDPDSEIFQALVLGTRDYVLKNGFRHVVVGLSGGIDSALTAAIAVAALGRGGVTGISMPSRYSSPKTRQDAREVARRLKISFREVPIERIFRAALATLGPVFGKRPSDVTEENLQARIRGSLLMALSNKFKWLVLATGNKSELSTGYCTLYGDMVGGFAVIKDLPKTAVYRLSRTANRLLGGQVIPESVFRRAPTAELRPHQTDQDTLPPYERLDRIIKAYVEEDLPLGRIWRGLRLSSAAVRRVIRMIDAAEYKRRQAPVGIKITPRAFGKDRRMPMTNRYREE
ncbi:MAG: NAD+ synthase [Candidatus Omnitrophica bacterium]|nr:NAD+ synthase [Candidatus Omnitrophota bacterium]